MAEKKKYEEAMKIDDSELEKIIGGLSTEDQEKINEALADVGKTVKNITDTLELVYNAAETNTCPICKDKSLPLVDKCKPSDFLNHVKLVHYSK